jgi:hypothetical protein
VHLSAFALAFDLRLRLDVRGSGEITKCIK